MSIIGHNRSSSVTPALSRGPASSSAGRGSGTPGQARGDEKRKYAIGAKAVARRRHLPFSTERGKLCPLETRGRLCLQLGRYQPSFVIPARAGTSVGEVGRLPQEIPAFAGMTRRTCLSVSLARRPDLAMLEYACHAPAMQTAPSDIRLDSAPRNRDALWLATVRQPQLPQHSLSAIVRRAR